jgi:hypothetical protein
VQLSSERGNQLDDLIAQRALAPPDAFDIVQEQIDHVVLVALGLAGPAIEELRAPSRWDRDTPPKHAG